jgi:hypothetical protein
VTVISVSGGHGTPVSVRMERAERRQHPAKSNGRDHPYVERRPGVCGGEPVIVGTRFPVRSVVTSIYRLGMTRPRCALVLP